MDEWKGKGEDAEEYEESKNEMAAKNEGNDTGNTSCVLPSPDTAVTLLR